MRNQLVFARTMQRGERQEPGVVTEIARDARFLQGLGGIAAQARNHDCLAALPFPRAAHCVLQHRLVVPRLANGELGRMDADRQSAGTGVEVVAGQRALARSIKPAVTVERQRMRRNNRPFAQGREHLRRPILPA
jgi:hypothetical protein